jgi:hypothetical protein
MGLSNYLPNSRISQAGVCTSATRPVSPYEGQVIYETDTDKVLLWNGSYWLQFRPATSYLSTELSVTSTSYTNISNTTPSLTLTTGTDVILSISTNTGGSSTGALLTVSFTVSGATTISGDDTKSMTLTNPAGGGGQRYRIGGSFPVTLNAGSNTFQVVCKSSTGSMVLVNTLLTVQNLI